MVFITLYAALCASDHANSSGGGFFPSSCLEMTGLVIQSGAMAVQVHIKIVMAAIANVFLS
ncbi:MAG: hypothetical protein ACRYG5_12535 [Janthinobacterium lividum]